MKQQREDGRRVREALTQEVLGSIRHIIRILGEVVDLLAHPFEGTCGEERTDVTDGGWRLTA